MLSLLLSLAVNRVFMPFFHHHVYCVDKEQKSSQTSDHSCVLCNIITTFAENFDISNFVEFFCNNISTISCKYTEHKSFISIPQILQRGPPSITI